MKRNIDKKVMFLSPEGIWETYYEDEYNNTRDYIESYADKMHIVQATPQEVASKCNMALFLNANDLVLYGYLPSKLTEEQKEQLNAFSELSLDNIKYMSITKCGKKSVTITSEKNISEKFGEVLASYNRENVSNKTI